MTDVQILDLDNAFERDTVKVGGKTYELRNQQEFSILQWHRIVRMDGEASRLQTTAAEKEEDAEKLAKLQRDLASMLVVDLDLDLEDWQCAAILRFWASRVAPPGDGDENGDAAVKPGGDADPPPASRRTGAGSSRSSKRSTAGSRKRGSTSPASR